MRFIDPKTDFAFKRIFGSKDSDGVLISFINAALELKGKYQVASVEIKNPYQVKHLPIEKQSIVDIACVDGRGTKYLVEMQVENVKGICQSDYLQCGQVLLGAVGKGRTLPSIA